MINENTLKFLNREAFGADIDGLESYIIDYKQANLVCNMCDYEYNYRKLVKILKEIKPESSAFKDDTSLDELDFDDFDPFIKEIGNYYPEIIYGSTDNKLENFKSGINQCEDGVADIMAVMNVTGLDISCTYINGILYRIYLIGKTYKYKNITEEIRGLLPQKIVEFASYDLVELRGKLTIFNNNKSLQTKSLNIPCSIIRILRDNLDTSKLSVVFDDIHINFDDIHIKSEELPYNNQWEKVEFIRDIGLDVPHHGLIRQIDSTLIETALKDLDEYFYDDIKDGIPYSFYGFKVRLNNELICNDAFKTIIYNTYDVDYRQKFSSVVKSLSTIGKYDFTQGINIVKAHCNDRLDIECINVDDIYDLEEHNVAIGSKLVFNVVERKGILFS